MDSGAPTPARLRSFSPVFLVRDHKLLRVDTMTDLDLDLDVGVWRVGRSHGPDWVACWFPVRRPAATVAGDAETRALTESIAAQVRAALGGER
jgi:hypothetical protein